MTLKKIGVKIFSLVAGKKNWQTIFSWLHLLALRGLNVGTGGDFNRDGELNIPRLIMHKFPSEQLTVFDVGANTGEYAVALANIFKEQALIYSFEPVSETYQELKKTTAEIKNIKTYQLGFSDRVEELEFFAQAGYTGFTSVYQQRFDHLNLKTVTVGTGQLTTIDQFCLANNIRRLHFLKIDTEGHEFKCLLGAAEKIKAGQVDFIQFELGACALEARIYFKDFFYQLHDQYDLYRIIKNGLWPIKKYSETLELFPTTNYLAILKN